MTARPPEVPPGFPPRFFERADDEDDADFYALPRFVTHIDARAIAAVGALYEDLGIRGRVLDLMGSWVSHFRAAPEHLTVLGMNERELAANEQAADWVLHDLNADPVLPFADASFDHATCCVSIDYLTDPVAVMRDVGRILRPDGILCCTFSNRLFPTKAVRGWLVAGEAERVRIAVAYFAASGAFAPATTRRCTPTEGPGDPLDAVWARRGAERGT